LSSFATPIGVGKKNPPHVFHRAGFFLAGLMAGR
jgi:hypothetical protein